jgi:hypothetical protein
VSDDLVISGGGSIAVATDELFSLQRHLATVADELDRVAGRLAGIDRLVSRGRLQAMEAPASGVRAEQAIDAAAALICSTRELAQFLASTLELAAVTYGEGEAIMSRLGERLAASLAYQLGFWLPAIGLFAAPGLLAFGLGAGGGVWLSLAITPDAGRRQAIHDLLQANKGVLSDPGFVATVRLMVSSADDFGEGVIRMPQGLAMLLGDDGLGILGLGSSAALVVAASNVVGAMKETGVSVSAGPSRAGGAPPAGFAERAARIPTGGAQVRIERYPVAGGTDRFEVYLGGTIDGSPIASKEPWDMTSNVTAIAGGDAGSYDATRQAMALAGIDSSTPVVFNGYSQGGLIASMLAASGDYDTRGLFTVGAPAGQVEVPHDIPYVAIEHSNDLVPAVGGGWKSSEPVLVTRELFDDGADASERYLPAHELSHYRETARLADAADEGRLTQAADALREFGSGATTARTTLYRAERD